LAGGGSGGFGASFTIFGGLNLTTSTFGGGKGLPSLLIIGGGGGGCRCAFFLLVTVKGMTSGPFSTLGLAVGFFLSCGLANRPIHNRQNKINVSLSFMLVILTKILKCDKIHKVIPNKPR